MTNISIQPLWLTHFIEILLVLEFQLTKKKFGAFSYKAHFRPQNSSNQMVHNKVGRLSLEAVHTWNAIFDGVMCFFSYDKRSPRKYLHKHIKHTRDQRCQNIIYRSMSVTKESDKNMQDYNITIIWERNQLYLNKMKKDFTTCALVLI